MKHRNLLLTSVLTIAVVGLFTAVLTSSLLPGNATAKGILAGHLHGAGHRSGWTGSCGELDERATRLMSAYLSITLDLDEAQEAALAPVIDVVERWHSASDGFCHGEVSTAPAAFDELDRMLANARAALNELRPAFDAFYGTLTAEQQAQLNGWISQHHGSNAVSG
ncbi:MAG: Spy/CpxP family protein refolding chaperone [Gammaproteobacteria bacterium]